MGLVECMEYDLSTKVGKIFSEILDILEDMAYELEGVIEDIETLYDYADELDADLGVVDEELYGEFDDEDYDDECDGDCDCLDDCGCCGEDKE